MKGACIRMETTFSLRHGTANFGLDERNKRELAASELLMAQPNPRSALFKGVLAVVSAVVTLALSLGAFSRGASSSPQQQLAAEIKRIEGRIAAVPDADEDTKSLKHDASAALATAKEALAAGRFYIALERVGQARGALSGAETVVENSAIVNGGLPAFEKEWRRANDALKDSEKQFRAGSSAAVPAAVRAIAEAYESQARTLYESSRAYAAVTSNAAGLYYLGRAKDSAGFALFCLRLSSGEQRPEPDFHSIAAELHNLQEAVIASYTPPRSIQHHREYIQINADIKFAGDLDAEQFYVGAARKYMDATQKFGALQALEAAAPNAGDLRSEAAQLQKRLLGEKSDSSLPQLFLERAESLLDATTPSSPSNDQLKDAEVILQKAVPAYFAALEARAQGPAPDGKEVTITLVRWPYT